MREILFRGKTNYEGRDIQWLYGSLLAESSNTFPIIAKDYDNDEEWIGIFEWGTVDPETVGQYTGLTDKNGEKIFEGDILKVKHGILGREEEKPKTPRNAYGLHYKENERGMYGRWFYYRNYAVEYKAHGNSKGKYIVRNGSDQCDFTNSLFYNHDAEIIGNIHDNPELLKGE